MGRGQYGCSFSPFIYRKSILLNCSHCQEMDHMRQPTPLVADVCQLKLLMVQPRTSFRNPELCLKNLLDCIADQVLLDSSSSQCLTQGPNAPHGSQPAPGLCIEKWTTSVHSQRDYKPNHAFHSLLDWVFRKLGTHETNIV